MGAAHDGPARGRAEQREFYRPRCCYDANTAPLVYLLTRTTQRVALNADVKAVLRCACGAVGVVVKEDIGNGQVDCPGCTKSYCVLCGNESHAGKPCPPPKETVCSSCACRSNPNVSHLTRTSFASRPQLKWLDKKSNNVTRCPNCGNAIQKAGGCDHMTCRPPGGCGFEFWFSCGCDFAKPHTCGKSLCLEVGKSTQRTGVDDMQVMN